MMGCGNWIKAVQFRFETVDGRSEGNFVGQGAPMWHNTIVEEVVAGYAVFVDLSMKSSSMTITGLNA